MLPQQGRGYYAYDTNNRGQTKRKWVEPAQGMRVRVKRPRTDYFPTLMELSLGKVPNLTRMALNLQLEAYHAAATFIQKVLRGLRGASLWRAKRQEADIGYIEPFSRNMHMRRPELDYYWQYDEDADEILTFDREGLEMSFIPRLLRRALNMPYLKWIPRARGPLAYERRKESRRWQIVMGFERIINGRVPNFYGPGY